MCVRYMELLTMVVGSDTQGQGQGNYQEGADTPVNRTRNARLPKIRDLAVDLGSGSRSRSRT